MPAPAGDRKADWAAFETVYREITDQVPDLRDKPAVVTLEAVVAALDDNHGRRSWWLAAMMRSAPSCLAASTLYEPTAPSRDDRDGLAR
ncbi:hypothetical protein [Nonomuraea phyllanthi]|uniref:hypothetical protein n=1 Tax=Nonomuraea phyllanthi TaxID=2219224 RepID=UPI001D153B9D|nr:hypothetical protein [Nonomuraea phyllanthi]